MLGSTNGQELLPGVPLSPDGWDTGWGRGTPWADGGLGIPASSSTSSAFPAAVSLETGSRKGHHFPVGKVGGQAVQQILPGRGVDERLWLLCCPAPAVAGRILPAQGSSRLWRGTSHSHTSPVLHISALGSGNISVWIQGHVGLTVTAGKAKDFVESQQSRRKKEQVVDREEENRWE